MTGVCGTAHVDLVRQLGADRVIDRSSEDFTRDDQAYGVVFDAVGKSSFARCRHLLRPHGVYLSTELGSRGQNPFLALVTPLLPGRSVLFAYPRHDQAMANRLRDLLESGQFRPVIDRSYPLSEAPDAIRYMNAGHARGKVVITV